MIIQMMKEFEILPSSATHPSSGSAVSGTDAAAWEEYYHTMHAVLIGVIQEELRSITVPKHHLLNTGILSRLNTTPDLAVGKSVIAAVGSNSLNQKGVKKSAVNSVSMGSGSSADNTAILPVTQLPVAVIVHYVNFVVFQKVLYMQHCLILSLCVCLDTGKLCIRMGIYSLFRNEIS